MEKEVFDLGTQKVSTLFKRIFLPTLFGMISMSVVTAADGIFIGNGVGSDGIAAVNICVPLLMIFTGFGLMSGVGSSVTASIYISKNKLKIARINVSQSMLFTTLITLVASAVICIFPESTGRLLGSSAKLMPLVKDYLIWFIPSLVFQMWISIGLFIIRLDGAPKLAMWCSVISALLNMILDWLFIFPFGWGIMGAAFATSISIFTGGVIAIYYLAVKAKFLKLTIPITNMRSIKRLLLNVSNQFKIGSSAMLGEFTMAVLMYVGNQIFMLYMGEDGVSAFGIACYYTPFVFMVGNAIAQSAQPILSYNYGIGKSARVLETQKIALIIGLVCGTVTTLIFTFLPEYLVGLFLPSTSHVFKLAVLGFPYYASGFIFFICNLSVIGYYQSLERVMPATIFALFRGVILLIPCFILLPKIVGETGIWFAMPMSEIINFTFIISFYLYKKGKYKSNIMFKGLH
ncbi:MAG: MATE family efflux transporter [Bacteroidales bacterium]|nr:MATE family efflux transporter [Bacteroidales bacterium]